MAVVRRTLVHECEVSSGSGLLLGVSGGPDSMALMAVMAELGPALGLRIAACGVDHGLRPEAKEELDLAQTYAERWNVPFQRRYVTIGGHSNLQAKARDARYAALEQCARDGALDYIVTAHHREDRAETVLLRLLRGAGPDGLSVLPPRLGDRLRPLVRTSKAQIIAYLEHRKIPFANDPSNDNPRFLRVRVRHELLPLMQELSPGIVEHLNNLADEQGLPPLPEIVGEHGEEIALNRSQRAQLRDALKWQRKRTEIWLSEGRAIVIDPETGAPRLTVLERPSPSGPQNSTSRATKSSKSH